MKIMVSTTTVREIYQFLKNKKKKKKKKKDCVLACLATLNVLVVRIALLEYSKIHEKVYKFTSNCHNCIKIIS